MSSRPDERNDGATRILVVVDWSADAMRVIERCRALAEAQSAVFGFLVPSRLHGLDWLGDPAASVPCARRQLDHLTELGERAGLSGTPVGVGDPEALTAIGDALARWRADEILLARARRLAPRPLSLARRARRATRLPVSSADARRRGRDHAGLRLMRLGRRHCRLELQQAP